jgi:hypothetical protein
MKSPASVTSGWWGFAAISAYGIFCVLTGLAAAQAGRPEAMLALAVVPLALAARNRPVLFAGMMICGGLWLRITLVAAGSDQIAVGQAAATLAAVGGNPYGHGYAVSVPPGAPFPYGPLMLLWAPLGILGEIVAAAGTMVVIAWTRSWITLATYSALLIVVALSVSGGNDVTPGFFVTVGMVVARQRPIAGALLLAVAAALKPYALAWFPGLIALGGSGGAIVLLAVTALTWGLAALLWSPGAIADSMALAERIHPVSANSFDQPVLRLLAGPVALAALLVRRWSVAALSGAVIFGLVLFMGHWASLGYLLVIAPLVGICLEEAAHVTLDGKRPIRDWFLRRGGGAIHAQP